MKNKEINSLLARAFFLVGQKEAEALDRYPDCALEHSREYTENMNGLVYGSHRAAKWSRRRVIAVIAIVLSIALLITACAYIEPVTDFIIEFFGGFARFSINNQNGPKHIDEAYLPSYIPEGYVKTDLRVSELHVYAVYRTDDEMRIIYSQKPKNVGGTNIYVGDGGYTETTVNGNAAYYVYSNNMYSLLWSDDECVYQISFDDVLPKEEIERVVYSIEPIDIKAG